MYTQLFSLVTWTSLGLMGAAGAVAGQNLGAGHPDRAEHGVHIAARFALDAAEIDRLRAASVLYDQVGDGIYLHAYTRAFDDRMFFEVVQRIGGYDAYGAANAGVRMAAQAKRGRSGADLIDSL